MTRNEAAGFTLIELMTVVVVVAILTAVAYPSYQEHVRKAKRAEGKTAVLKAAQVQERYYSDKATYVTNADFAPLFGLPKGDKVYSGENAKDDKSAYALKVEDATADCPIAACFVLTATPQGSHTDATCGNLTITSTGVRCWSTSGTTAFVCNSTAASASTCKW